MSVETILFIWLIVAGLGLLRSLVFITSAPGIIGIILAGHVVLTLIWWNMPGGIADLTVLVHMVFTVCTLFFRPVPIESKQV